MGLKPLLARLPSLKQANDRVISLYLPIKSQGYEAHYCQLSLEHLKDAYKENLNRDEQARLAREAEGVLGRLNILRPSGWPGLAVFSEEGRGVWEWMPLPEPVKPRLEYGGVLLAPLMEQLQKHPAALIALVDKEEVRSLGVVLGETFPLGDMQGKGVKQHRSGDSMAAANARRVDTAVKLNLKKAVEVIAYEMVNGGYSCLYLGGPSEARSQFEKMLPKALQAKVSGYVSVGMYESNGQLFKELRAQMQ